MTWYPRGALKERFWSKVALPNEDGCMLWTASCYASGYGQFFAEGKHQRANRIALLLTEGSPDDPRKVDALHSCPKPTPACAAPGHLRWGTESENMMDKLRDGTDPRGEKHGLAKVTEEQVREMRRRYVPGNGEMLAREYGISRRELGRIVRGERWSWLTA